MYDLTAFQELFSEIISPDAIRENLIQLRANYLELCLMSAQSDCCKTAIPHKDAHKLSYTLETLIEVFREILQDTEKQNALPVKEKLPKGAYRDEKGRLVQTYYFIDENNKERKISCCYFPNEFA